MACLDRVLVSAGHESCRYDRCVISYADPAALIDAPGVLRVAIAGNGEPLADLRTVTALDVDQARAQVRQLSDNPFRELAARARQACDEQVRSAAGHRAGRGSRG